MKSKEIVSQATLIHQRQEGLTLISPIRTKVVALTVKTEEEYVTADSILTDIRKRRDDWKAINLKATEALREAMAAQKTAMDAYKEVYDAIDKPLRDFEVSVKQLMADYKMEERRLLAEADQKNRENLARLEAEARAKEQREANAKTNAMREKLAEQRAVLEQQLAQAKATVSAKPLKTAGSTARLSKKWRVTDIQALLTHIVKMGKAADLFSLIEVDSVQMESYFKLQKPELGEWLPGVEVYEDISIAGKKR